MPLNETTILEDLLCIHKTLYTSDLRGFNFRKCIVLTYSLSYKTIHSGTSITKAIHEKNNRTQVYTVNKESPSVLPPSHNSVSLPIVQGVTLQAVLYIPEHTHTHTHTHTPFYPNDAEYLDCSASCCYH